MKRLTHTCALLVGFALSSFPAVANEGWQEENSLGTTDWSRGVIETTGQGTARYIGNKIQEEMMAKQAAKTDAQVKLLELVKGVRLTGLTTLGADGQGQSRAATRIKGLLTGAKVIDSKIDWTEDKSSRRGEVPFAQVTLRLCLNQTCSPSQKVEAASNAEDSAVIIDLEQALFLPSLAPQIQSQSGETLYSENIATQITGDAPYAHYVKSVERARAHPIGQSNAVIIKAIGINPDNHILISDDDANRIKGLPALKQGKLLIALD